MAETMNRDQKIAEIDFHLTRATERKWHYEAAGEKRDVEIQLMVIDRLLDQRLGLMF